MPRIPRFSPVSGGPPGTSGGVPVDPGQAGRVGGAVAGVGQDIAQTGDYAGRVYGQIRKAERAIRATSIENTMRNDLEDSAQSYANRTDWGVFESEAQKTIETLRKKYSDAAGDDPNLLASVNQAFDYKSGEYVRTIRSKALVEMTKQGQGELQKTYNNSVQDAAGDISPENVEIERARMSETINLYVENGIITNKQGVTYLESFDKDVETTRARREILSDPKAAAEKLDDPKNYPNMDEDIRIQLQTYATNRAKIQETEAKQKIKDAETKQKELEDDEIYKTLGSRDFTKAYELIEKSSLSPHEKNAWHANMRARQERIKKEDAEIDPTKITDPETYTRISDIVYNRPQEIKTAAEIYNLVGRGLSEANGDRFVRLWKEDKKASDENTKIKDASRKTELGYAIANIKDHPAYGYDPEGVVAKAKAIEELQDWAEANPNKNISEKLEQMLIPVKEKQTKSWLDGMFDFTPNTAVKALLGVEKLLRPEGAEKPQQTKRQQAIDALKSGGYQINEDSIKKIMDQIK